MTVEIISGHCMYKRKELNRLTKKALMAICLSNNLRVSDSKIQMISTILGYQEHGTGMVNVTRYDKFSVMTCSQLRAECKKLHLPVSGNKFTLVTRLIGGWTQ